MRRAGPLLLATAVLLILGGGLAHGYGYSTEEDPLLDAFRDAVAAARAGDVAAAKAQVERVRWLTDELALPDGLQVSFRDALLAAHADGASEAQVVAAWANLVYLALVQKLRSNLSEELADYHKARARLDAVAAYYELALAGNVRKDDAARRATDPKAPSRHEDIVAQLALARAALGSPGLLGAGAKPPDVEAFRKAALRIVGHLNAVFPTFVRPGGRG